MGGCKNDATMFDLVPGESGGCQLKAKEGGNLCISTGVEGEQMAAAGPMFKRTAVLYPCDNQLSLMEYEVYDKSGERISCEESQGCESSEGKMKKPKKTASSSKNFKKMTAVERVCACRDYCADEDANAFGVKGKKCYCFDNEKYVKVSN